MDSFMEGAISAGLRDSDWKSDGVGQTLILRLYFVSWTSWSHNGVKILIKLSKLLESDLNEAGDTATT